MRALNNDNIRIHVIQHVAFEGPGAISLWAQQRGFPLTTTRLYADDALPELTDFDLLVIMGGPMGVYDQADYAWIDQEQVFITEAIEQGKKVFGICLGAQFIAAAMGAKVSRNAHKEIGWYAIEKSTDLHGHWLDQVFPAAMPVLHWHGDTFALPVNARRIAASTACKNQGFVLGDKVVGLQFHIESTPESVAQIVESCADELIEAEYIQAAEQILGTTIHYDRMHQILFKFLDELVRQSERLI